jgi:hypothetical protein
MLHGQANLVEDIKNTDARLSDSPGQRAGKWAIAVIAVQRDVTGLSSK